MIEPYNATRHMTRKRRSTTLVVARTGHRKEEKLRYVATYREEGCLVICFFLALLDGAAGGTREYQMGASHHNPIGGERGRIPWIKCDIEEAKMLVQFGVKIWAKGEAQR